MLIDIGTSNNSTCEFGCRSYTLKHKWLTVHAVETHIAFGLNITEACSLVRVERCVYYRWKKTLCLWKERDGTASETGSTEMVAVHDASVEIEPTPHVAFLLEVKKIHHENLRCHNLGIVGFFASKKMQLLRWILNRMIKAYR